MVEALVAGGATDGERAAAERARTADRGTPQDSGARGPASGIPVQPGGPSVETAVRGPPPADVLGLEHGGWLLEQLDKTGWSPAPAPISSNGRHRKDRISSFVSGRSARRAFILATAGPTLVHVVVAPGSEGPISRGDAEHARYLKTSLAEWSRSFRAALAGSREL